MRNPERWADLHIHSSFSDGEWSPKEIVLTASKLGLSAIAITDHDTIAGIKEAEMIASTAGVEIIPAVEINTDYNEREIHILGYYLDINSPALVEGLKRQREARLKRNEEIVDKLNKLGLKISFEEVLGLAGGESLGRPHIAQALVNRGYAQCKEEAFAKWLKRGSPAYVPRRSISWQEAIKLINQASGIAVLAHPGKSYVDYLIPHIVKEGLQGIEVRHPSHTPEDSERYKQICRDLCLLATGGSDAHSFKDIPLIEQFKVPLEYVEKLKEKKR
jgi:predicted metal-dependent phosphoesterase TrpH